jgi:hypothetical protein
MPPIEPGSSSLPKIHFTIFYPCLSVEAEEDVHVPNNDFLCVPPLLMSLFLIVLHVSEPLNLPTQRPKNDIGTADPKVNGDCCENQLEK